MVILAMVLAVAMQAAPALAPNPCAAARPLRLLPVDQASAQPDFFTFRARLQSAIARRDEAAVLAVADPCAGLGRSDSAVVGSVSYEIVQVLPAQQDSGTRCVRLASGRTGFIASSFVRSPIDYRAIFQKTGGQWRLRAFVAGD